MVAMNGKVGDNIFITVMNFEIIGTVCVFV